MDKLAKVRAEIEKLNAQLLRGACASQIAMETRCKEEAYNEVLSILDSLQEEPVSEELEEAAKNHAVERYRVTRDMVLAEKCKWSFQTGAKWKEKQMMSKAVDCHATFEFYGLDSKTYGTIAHDPICFEDFDIKDSDKVKMVLIKEE